MSISLTNFTQEERNIFLSKRVYLDLYSSKKLINAQAVQAMMYMTTLADSAPETTYIRSECVTTANYVANITRTLSDLENRRCNENQNELIIISTACLNAELKENAKALLDSWVIRKRLEPVNLASILIQTPNHKVAAYRTIGTEIRTATIILTSVYDERLIECACVAHAVAMHYNLPEEHLTAMLMSDTDYIKGCLKTFIAQRIKAEREKSFAEITAYADKYFGVKTSMQQLNEQLERLRAEAMARQVALNDTLQKVAALNKALLDAMTREKTEDAQVKEFKEYFNAIKDSVLAVAIRGVGSQLNLYIQTPLQYWESKNYEALCKGIRRGNCLSTFNATELNLLNKIFVTGEYKLMLATEIVFQSDRGYPTVNRSNYFSDNKSQLITFIANPHIKEYNCWGDNTDLIRACAESGDIVGMWAQIMSALSGIDFTDSSVCNRFFNTMHRVFRGDTSQARTIKDNPEGLVKKDGTCISIAAALKECE